MSVTFQLFVLAMAVGLGAGITATIMAVVGIVLVGRE